MKRTVLASPALLMAIACTAPYGASTTAAPSMEPATPPPRAERTSDADASDATGTTPTGENAPDEAPPAPGCGGHVCEDFDKVTQLDAPWSVESPDGTSAAIVETEESLSPPHVFELSVPALGASQHINALLSRRIMASKVTMTVSLNLQLETGFAGVAVNNYVAPIMISDLERKVWIFAHADGFSIQDCNREAGDCNASQVLEPTIPTYGWTNLTVEVDFAAGHASVTVDGAQIDYPLKTATAGADVLVQLGLDARTAEGSTPPARVWFDNLEIR